MEKIKITREQEEALESYKVFIRELKTDAIQYFIDNFKYWQTEFKPLQTFTLEQFLKLLCGWYEVEQPFKVGDWVRSIISNKYYKVTNKLEIDSRKLTLASVINEDAYASVPYEKITEPWKIMLLELGRDKPELKKGDVYTRVDKFSFSIKADTEEIPDSFLEGRIKYFYPVESRIEVKQ